MCDKSTLKVPFRKKKTFNQLTSTDPAMTFNRKFFFLGRTKSSFKIEKLCLNKGFA